MDENQLIEQKFGKENPFRVPSGYFDSFTDHVMGQLPSEETPIIPISKGRRWRLAIGVAAAACLSLVLLNVGRSWMSSPADTQPNTATVLPLHTAYYDDDDDVDERFEEFADYAMIDVDDIYAYVSEYQ